MRDQSAWRGLIVMITGLLMVGVSVILVLTTDAGSPAALGVVGIVFVAVGASRRRDAAHRR